MLEQKTPQTPPRFTAKQAIASPHWAYSQIDRRTPAAGFQRNFRIPAPSIHQMLKTLDHLGLIEKQLGVPRSIQLLVPPWNCPCSAQSNPS